MRAAIAAVSTALFQARPYKAETAVFSLSGVPVLELISHAVLSQMIVAAAAVAVPTFSRLRLVFIWLKSAKEKVDIRNCTAEFASQERVWPSTNRPKEKNGSKKPV